MNRRNIELRIKKIKETEGDGLEDWLYLIHHLHEQDGGGEEKIHHCQMVDHLGNLFEVAHVIDEKGEIQHCLIGLVEDQEVYWSNEEAEADGETIPCANRQLESK